MTKPTCARPDCRMPEEHPWHQFNPDHAEYFGNHRFDPQAGTEEAAPVCSDCRIELKDGGEKCKVCRERDEKFTGKPAAQAGKEVPTIQVNAETKDQLDAATVKGVSISGDVSLSGAGELPSMRVYAETKEQLEAATVKGAQGAAMGPHCECVCHKVGLLGFMCCPCTVAIIQRLANSREACYLNPLATPETSSPATTGVSDKKMDLVSGPHDEGIYVPDIDQDETGVSDVPRCPHGKTPDIPCIECEPAYPTKNSSAPDATEEREAQIRERESKATPGPWIYSGSRDERGVPIYSLSQKVRDTIYSPSAVKANLQEDKDFIAHARADIPWLLTQLEEARRERDLAIAHDRQPYPTAEAYEKVCEARTKWQARAEQAESDLATARQRIAVLEGKQ